MICILTGSSATGRSGPIVHGMPLNVKQIRKQRPPVFKHCQIANQPRITPTVSAVSATPFAEDPFRYDGSFPCRIDWWF